MSQKTKSPRLGKWGLKTVNEFDYFPAGEDALKLGRTPLFLESFANKPNYLRLGRGVFCRDLQRMAKCVIQS